MKNKKPQDVWNFSAEAWADFVRTGKDYYREELNNPAMFELLGDIQGKVVLDLGCGEGYNSRLMAGKGARVVGVDFSARMIELAIQRERQEKLGIEYQTVDACDLHDFRDETFDVVACFMALQDIENHRAAVGEVSRVLKRDGRFVFVIPHPCFETRILDGRPIGGWELKPTETEDSSAEAVFYKVDRYFDVHEYVLPWQMGRLSQHFETVSFHRTLTDYADALHDARLAIWKLKEPRPTRESIEKCPELRLHLRIAQSVAIEAVKLPSQSPANAKPCDTG